MKVKFKKRTNKDVSTKYVFMASFWLKITFNYKLQSLFLTRKKSADQCGFSYEIHKLPIGVNVCQKLPKSYRTTKEVKSISLFKLLQNDYVNTSIGATSC